MSSPAFDNPLKLLKDEIETNLGRIQDALESYMEDPEDSDQLPAVQTWVNEIRGGFFMLGEITAAALCNELTALVGGLHDGSITQREQARDVLLRGILQLPRFLEWMQREGEKPDFDLRILIDRVRDVRGLPPIGLTADGAIIDMSALAIKARPALQRHLLSLLRKQAVNAVLERLAHLFQSLAESSPEMLRRRLWADAVVIAREVRAGNLALELDIHRLFRDLDQELKRMVGAEPATPDRLGGLVTRMEQVLERSDGGRTHLAAVGRALPGGGEETAEPPALLDVETLLQIAGYLREALTLVKDAVDRMARDPDRNVSVIEGHPDRIHILGNVLELLNLGLPRQFANRVEALLKSWQSQSQRISDRELLQVAADLILIENSLDSIGDGHLLQALSQIGIDIADPDAHADLLVSVEHRRSRRILVHEGVISLGRAREALVEAGTTPPWEEVGHDLYLLKGVFALLGQAAPTHLIQRLVRATEALAAGQAVTAPEKLLAHVAEVVVALEYLLAGMAEGKPTDPALLSGAMSRMQAIEGLFEAPLAKLDLASVAAPITPALLKTGTEAPAPTEATPAADATPPAGAPAGETPSAPEAVTVSPQADVPVAVDADIVPDIEVPPADDRPGPAPSETVDERPAEGVDDWLPEDGLAATAGVSTDETLAADIELIDLDDEVAGSEEPQTVEPTAEPISHQAPSSDGFDFDFSEFDNAFDEPAQPAAVQEPAQEAEPAADVPESWPAQPAADATAPEVIDERAGLTVDFLDPADFQDAFGSWSEPADTQQDGQPSSTEDDGFPDLGETAVTEPVVDVEEDQENASDIDPEFLEIFFEEAQGEVENIRNGLESWRGNPDDRDTLTSIRRSFHTLKGSGRMVGQTTLGEFAWRFERLLNKVLERSISPSDALVEATEGAVGVIEEIVEANGSLSGLRPRIEALQAWADTLADGQVESPVVEAPDAPAVNDASVDDYRHDAPVADAGISEPEAIEAADETAAPSIDAEPVAELPTTPEAASDVQSPEVSEADWTPVDEAPAIVDHPPLDAEDVFTDEPAAVEEPATAWQEEAPAETAPVEDDDAPLPAIEDSAAGFEPIAETAPVEDDDVPLPAIEDSAAGFEPIAETAQPTDRIAEPDLPAAPVYEAEPEFTAAPAADMDADPELVEVFLEEAVEILDNCDNLLQRLAGDPGSAPLLNEMRRDMHTLKGSSRMAGFGVIGDLGHTAENLLDAVATGEVTASDEVIDAIQRTMDSLNSMVSAARTGQSMQQDNALLSDLLRLSGIEPPPELAAAKPKAPPRAAVAVVVEPEPPVIATLTVEDLPPPAQPEPAPAIAPPIDAEVEEIDPELREVFLAEAAEILNASDVILQQWSQHPEKSEHLNDMRREMHTLKGSSRMASYRTIGDLAHAMESLLDGAATGHIRVNKVTFLDLQAALDQLNEMLGVARAGRMPGPASGDILAALESWIGDRPPAPDLEVEAGSHPDHRIEDEDFPAANDAPVPAAATETESTGDTAAEVPEPAQAAVPAPRPAPPPVAERPVLATTSAEDTIRVNAKLLNNLVNQMGESSIFRSRVDQGVGSFRFGLGELDQTVNRLRQQLRRLEIETEAQILFRYEEGGSDLHAEFDPLELDRFSELQQLSRSLMEIVDDLNNIQNTLDDQAQDMSFLLDQQGKVNKEIQENLMRTRMVGFSTVVPRLRRVVRQAAQELGKKIELQVEGTEAEVDRTVLENMVAPLEHLLRNSVSHGIETPEARLQAGKSVTGNIDIKLRREGAELVIVVSDDGAGLNYEAIRQKGVSMGLLRPEQRPSEPELVTLLLQPGFSTAEKVTQISGRGVGMDVVNDTIRGMRGALQIASRRGKGAVFTIRLPFSLAVTQALLVSAGGETYAVPLLSVEAVTRLAEGEYADYLEGKAVTHEYSGNRYALHSLGVLFRAEGDSSEFISPDSRPPALLFRSGESSAALQIDAVIGNQEIIVKPVGRQLHGVPGVSGATVLGDGRVIVVLELAALVRAIAQRSEAAATATGPAVVPVVPEIEEPARAVTAMVIDDSITMRKVTSRFLERHGVVVSAAKDGVEAVALLEEQAPDLAILDIEMPRMDGFEVLAHIRNQERLKNLKVIMVTSRSGEKHRDRATRLGVDDYLIKPYQEEEMMSSIRRLLGDRARELTH